jgi:hypothetical protein
MPATIVNRFTSRATSTGTMRFAVNFLTSENVRNTGPSGQQNRAVLALGLYVSRNYAVASVTASCEPALILLEDFPTVGRT